MLFRLLSLISSKILKVINSRNKISFDCHYLSLFMNLSIRTSVWSDVYKCQAQES